MITQTALVHWLTAVNALCYRLVTFVWNRSFLRLRSPCFRHNVAVVDREAEGYYGATTFDSPEHPPARGAQIGPAHRWIVHHRPALGVVWYRRVAGRLSRDSRPRQRHYTGARNRGRYASARRRGANQRANPVRSDGGHKGAKRHSWA